MGLESKVSIVTDLPGREQHRLHAAADIFVSPVDSLQESGGITPVEAMACGVPQVVSDWDGYRDTVDHGVTGFRVRTIWAPCDEDAVTLSMLSRDHFMDHLRLGQSVAVDLAELKESLSRLIVDGDLRGRMGEASRKRAVERFAWPVIIRRYEALWQELSEIAQSEPRRRSEPSYSEPRFFDVFRGFATEILSDEALLRSTEGGVEVAAAGGPKSSYDVLDDALLHDLLVRVGTRGESLATLIPAFAQRAPASRIRAHAMWLIKYGLLERARGRDGRDPASSD
jgi:hypothetical protein